MTPAFHSIKKEGPTLEGEYTRGKGCHNRVKECGQFESSSPKSKRDVGEVDGLGSLVGRVDSEVESRNRTGIYLLSLPTIIPDRRRVERDYINV